MNSQDRERVKALVAEWRANSEFIKQNVQPHFGDQISIQLADAFPALLAALETAERERDALWVSMHVVWQVALAAIRAGEMGGNPLDLFVEQHEAIQQVLKAAVNVIGFDPDDTLKAVFPEFVNKQTADHE